MKESDRQLFILDDHVWDSMSFDDVAATIDDMRELDICKPPMAKFDIMTKMEVIDRIQDELSPDDSQRMGKHHYHRNMIWRFTFDDSFESVKVNMLHTFDNGKTWLDFARDVYERDIFPKKNMDEKEKLEIMTETQDWIHAVSTWVAAYLIVALAARNIVKTTKENKLAKLGIGKKNQKNNYKYTTSVTIGKITETLGTGDSTKGGWKVRPHLRRGHIREQHYGPRSEEHTSELQSH